MALILERNNRRVVAMILDYQFRNVQGVVQCAVSGCDEQRAIPAEKDPGEFCLMFMASHECGGCFDVLDLRDLFTVDDGKGQ
jgi:hypothetical protein